MDFQNFIEVRDLFISKNTKTSRKKLLYGWVSKNLISYEFFDALTDHIT